MQKGFANEKWNLESYNDVLYPNIKLKHFQELNKIKFTPNIEAYKKSNGFQTIPNNSRFRNAGPYFLDHLPDEFNF